MQTQKPEELEFQTIANLSGLWSQQLKSLLVVTPTNHLRLYDAQGQLRLTKEEALNQQLEVERQRIVELEALLAQFKNQDFRSEA